MRNRKWKPSNTAKREFAQKMKEIDDFCADHNIHASSNNDSYYFEVNGQQYRVSNHSVESSNSHAITPLGEKIRSQYHPEGRLPDIIYIHASKTRIIEIYNDICLGYKLNGRGERLKKGGN